VKTRFILASVGRARLRLTLRNLTSLNTAYGLDAFPHAQRGSHLFIKGSQLASIASCHTDSNCLMSVSWLSTR